MSTAAHSLAEIAEFWRVVRRLYAIYAELDRTFELGTPPCPELEQNVDRSEPEVLERIRLWFHNIDSQVHVWQLRQLLQSTNLQTEENLRYLVRRHLDKDDKTDADKEKIDFLLVQYFAHSAPHGVTEHDISLESVAAVLQPALGEKPSTFPSWTAQLDEKLQKLNESSSLEEIQNSGGLLEARQMKASTGEHYFDTAALVTFTRFNFLARRAFFRAMHLDLHAIRGAVNELERMGFSTLDCRDAGLTETESLEQVRHVVHQWKTPFRAPYTAGGSSFQPLILLRHSLQRTLENAKAKARAVATPKPVEVPPPSAAAPAKVTLPPKSPVAPKAVPSRPEPTAASPASSKAVTPPPPPASPSAVSPAAGATAPSPLHVVPAAETGSHSHQEEEDYLQRCVDDIAEQLAAMPPKSSPGVSTITLGGCKLFIATWEAEAFKGDTQPFKALQRAVAARTILHVCIDRHKKNEATDLTVAMEIAERQAEEMKVQVVQAKEASNIDAAVNLAATAKRLMALVEEGHKLGA